MHSAFYTHRPLVLLTALAAATLAPATALAAPAGAGLPWEDSFNTVFESINGLAPIFAGIAAVIAFAAIMFGEGGGLSRRAVNFIVGGAGLFGVPAVLSTLFSGSAGALF